MKIGIISDTHNRPTGIDGAFKVFEEAGIELIIHCGDWARPETAAYFSNMARAKNIPVKGVLGNNDKEVAAFLALSRPGFELSEGVISLLIGGKDIRVYHGHHQPSLRKLLLEDTDVLCLGHSHKPRYDRIDDKVILNPGSTAFAIPRSKSWRASVAIYDTNAHEAEFAYFAPV
ncbi:MAG: metallophosphoesterase [Candidatus Saccharibacteria bacterium]|nr:metallophosphoesterase [Candidatus Saccharibacteria bacterium]